MPDVFYRPLQEACLCGNDDPMKIKRYFAEDQLYGIFCEACKVEWLNEDAMPQDDGDEVDGINPHIELGGQNLHKNKPQAKQFDPNLQVNARTKVEDLSQLKSGDHFAYDRPYFIWHHGIVKQVDKANRRFEAVHWNKKDGRLQITESWVNIAGEMGKLYRIDYPEVTSRTNKVQLVIARAMSMIGQIGYNFFTKNCEHFARFCKVGLAESIQTHYFINLIKRTVACIYTRILPKASVLIATAGQYFTAEMIENLVNGSNVVGAGFVVLFEGVLMIWDLRKIRKQRNGDEISFEEYVNATIKRVMEGVCTAGGTIVGGLIGEFAGGMAGACVGAAIGTMICPVFGTAVGAAVGKGVGVFFGGIIGATIGGFLSHAGGKIVGRIIGGSIVSLIKHGDRPVKSITDLEEGDQIVFYCWPLHPRCHAIVVCHDGEKRVMVIRSTYERGVVEEWVAYKEPIFKVIYKPDECLPTASTMILARSKIGGKYEYNLLTNNCKHFAEWCKV